MKITSISYKQKFPIGQFLNCDIGFEASFSEGESVNDVLLGMKLMAEAFHKQEFPHLYVNVGNDLLPLSPNQAQQPSSEEQRINALIQDINACTAISEKNSLGVEVGLLGYEKLASGDAALKAAYDLKLMKLKKDTGD